MENAVNKYMLFTAKPKPDRGIHADVFLSEVIAPPHNYLDLFHFLNDATEEDSCTIHIDNQGGMLSTGITIGTMIERTKATVETKGLSIAASAAALVFTKGHKKSAFPWGHVMYHTASYMKGGTVKDHEDTLNFIKPLISRIMKETMEQKLITPQDVEAINNNAKDIFVPGNIINHRISSSISGGE